MNALISFLVVLLLSAVFTVDAKLRGVQTTVGNTNFDDLKLRVKNPKLRDDIRGKTVRELMGDAAPPLTEKKGSVREDRSLQATDSWAGRTLQFFTVYDEFGPSVSKIGETAGLNGLIYNIDSYATGQLTEDDVIGALKGTCSVVSSNHDHFCTYELLIAEADGSAFGSVISSGALEFKPGSGGFLIIEAAGDSYEEFKGGLVSFTYQTIGAQTILMGELSLV